MLSFHSHPPILGRGVESWLLQIQLISECNLDESLADRMPPFSANKTDAGWAGWNLEIQNMTQSDVWKIHSYLRNSDFSAESLAPWYSLDIHWIFIGYSLDIHWIFILEFQHFRELCQAGEQLFEGAREQIPRAGANVGRPNCRGEAATCSLSRHQGRIRKSWWMAVFAQFFGKWIMFWSKHVKTVEYPVVHTPMRII